MMAQVTAVGAARRRGGMVRTQDVGRALVAVALVAAVALGATGCSEPEPAAGAGPSTTPDTSVPGAVTAGRGDGTTVLSGFAGQRWFRGEVPTPRPADGGDPVRVGFMNVDAGPVGAMPELHAATDAAVRLVNAELGGVGGRPVEVVPCLLSNPMSAEESQACARRFVEAGVVAVLGGIGLATGPGLAVLEDNRIPYVGGIPINDDEMANPISFQFSGGSPGAFASFSQQAVAADDARRVAVLFAEYPSIQAAAQEFGTKVARSLGAEVTEVSFPMVSQDYVAPVQKALESRPDALFVGAADLACAPIMQAIADLDRPVQVYMVGSCADMKQVDKVGVDRVVGFRFNVENRIDQTASDAADTEIYTAAMERYAPGTTPRSAATVAFRGAMNLWAVMDDVGTGVTAGSVIDELRASRDRPSFDGHPYTCDGRQVPSLPSLCAPQEVVAELTGPGEFVEASAGWIDVPAVLRRAGAGQ